MKEYYGKSANIYKQRKINLYMLMPGIKKYIPKSEHKKGKLLDVGCGNGDYFTIAKNKGYEYWGLDISKDMISRAKKDHPQGKYLVASSANLSKCYKDKFDIIILSMLLPALKSKDAIVETLKEAKKVLRKNGKIIISIGHPCFDHYMQKYLFGRKDVKTNFEGYFKSSTKFQVVQKFDGKPFVFEDYHRTLTDYFNAIVESGLSIIQIEECRPLKTKNISIDASLDKYRLFPIYFLFVCG